MPDLPDPILVLYNSPSGSTCDVATLRFAESEVGVMEEVRAVCESLERQAIPALTVGLRNIEELAGALFRHSARIAFNLIEGFPEQIMDHVLVPAVCRAMGVEVTGCDTPCQALAQDKWITKQVLAGAGLRCPQATLVRPGEPVPDLDEGLWIVKPSLTDGSEGIDEDAVVKPGSPELAAAIRRIHDRLRQPAVVERLVGDMEINVSLLQMGQSVEPLPLAAIDFSAFGPERPRIVGYKAKWIADSFEYIHTPRIVPAPLDDALTQEIRCAALVAWRALGCRDYARVDFRVNSNDNTFYILEVNPNPDISPSAGFAAALTAGGISFDQFVHAILDNAAERLPPSVPIEQMDRRLFTSRNDGRLRIRCITAADRDHVLSLLTQPAFFRPDELRIAREVLDDSIRETPTGDYQSFVVEDEGAVVGWICFGPTPCTVATYDIYWIAVARNKQRRGIGRAMMEFAEARIRDRGGKKIVIETSGRSDYAPTRAFYARVGYQQMALIPDFYAPGDDKIIFMKAL